MRVIPVFEKKKRGCPYCLKMTEGIVEGVLRTNCCPYDKCPYTVLDNYKTYEEFMASEDSKILVSEFFVDCGEIGGLYEVDRKPNRNFSDGDGKVGL